MTRNEEYISEKKFLLAIHGTEVFEGSVIRQERPYCCGAEIDLLEAKLTFPEVRVQNRTFTLVEPYCPHCGRRVRALFQVLN